MRLIFYVATIFILIFSAGCGSENDPEQKIETVFCVVQDDNSREIALAQKPKRIVVTSASFIEPLYKVGGSVVGRPISKNASTDFAKDAAEIGTVYQIDTEKLLACAPDLVIINKGMNEKLSDILDENKIPYIVLNMKSYDDVTKNIFTFGEITGNTEVAFDIIESMNFKIKNIVQKLPPESKRVAILHGTAQGLSVQLDNSIAGNVLQILGWKNVASGMKATKDDGDTAPYSLETLVEQNPEIIFVTSMGNIDEIKANIEKMISENPAWQTIPAIQDGKIYYLPQDLFLLSPGVHYPDAVKYMANLVYSEIKF